MIPRWSEPALYLLALVCVESAARTIAHPAVSPGAVSPIPVLGAPPPPRPDGDSLAEAVGIVVEGNLFRAERHSVVDSAVAPPPAYAPAVMRPPRPALALRGLLGGPPWDAIVEGFPGREGAIVVRSGQRVGELTVRAVRRDTVIIRGNDTTWTLTLRTP